MSEEKKWVLGLKRAISFIICLIILFTYPTKLMAAQEPPEEAELFAKAAVLMDGGSGRILYSKNGSEALANASTTKILTCIIALENCDLEQIAEVSVQAAKAPKVHLGAPAGQKFRMKDLIYAMMLESFNDCAVVIAEQVAGTTEHFSKMMNDYAKKIGCRDTFFITPNGLDAQKDSQFHHTTAEDLAQIMRYCIKKSPKADQFLKITGEAEYTFTDVSGKYAYHCYNHNAFLKMMDGAVSGKTGFTGNAGYCYVGALEQNGKTYIVALLACGWPNNRTYKWSDTRKLMEYGLAAYELCDLDDIALDGSRFAPVPIEHAQGGRIGEQVYMKLHAVLKKDLSHVLLREGEQVTVEYRIAQKLSAPVKKGSCAGAIYYKLGGMVLREYQVETTEDMEKLDFEWCLRQVLKLAV